MRVFEELNLCCDLSINGYYDRFRLSRDDQQSWCVLLFNPRVGVTINTPSSPLFFRSPQAIARPIIFYLVGLSAKFRAIHFDHLPEYIYAGLHAHSYTHLESVYLSSELALTSLN